MSLKSFGMIRFYSRRLEWQSNLNCPAVAVTGVDEVLHFGGLGDSMGFLAFRNTSALPLGYRL